jgi:hypothetical protein
MVAYSFQRQFADPILMGRKRHTVRAPRKRHARPGEALQLYTGMRTKSCRLIARATCESVEPIGLYFHRRPSNDWVMIGARTLDRPAALDEFAYSDGFDDWGALRAFWLRHHGSLQNFDGLIIKWRDMVPG